MQCIFTFGPFPVVRLGSPAAVDEKSRQVALARDIGSEPKLETALPAGLDAAEGSLASRLFGLSPWAEAILENQRGGGLPAGLDRVVKLVVVCLSSMHHMSIVPCSKTDTWDHPKCPTLNSLFAMLFRKKTLPRKTGQHHHQHHGAGIVQGNEFAGARFRWHRVYLKKSMESQNGLPKGQDASPSTNVSPIPHAKKKTGTTAVSCPNPKSCSQPKSQKPISFCPKPHKCPESHNA